MKTLYDREQPSRGPRIFFFAKQVVFIEIDTLFLQLNQNVMTNCHPLIYFVRQIVSVPI